MTENSNNDNPQAKLANIYSIIESTQKQLEQEVKELNKTIDSQTQEVDNRGKSIFDSNYNKISTSIEDLKKMLEKLLNEHQSSNSEELLSLKESLDGQLDSLRGYANQLVEDEELKLVTTLETSLTNVNDITKDKSSDLNVLIAKISTLADESTSSPVKIVQDMNAKVKEEITEALSIEKSKLTESITNLQEEFRDKIGSQIEKVFMGVTVTKESVNGIIQDTLSRLEENLNRLNAGIDENFTNEIGVTQDIIHDYEGKLIETIGLTQENYNTHMAEIVEKYSQKTLSSLDELKTQLQNQKDKVNSEVSELTKSQNEIVNHAISQLEDQIIQSKAEVIESHGVLKDDLEKLLLSNSDTIKQSIESIQSTNQTVLSNLMDNILQVTNQQTSELSEEFKTTKKEFEQSFDQFRKAANQKLNVSQQHIKNFDTAIKKEKS
ncbi:MAG: hypothetical protein ACXAD7_04125 [Candidatus Kariarchaeaceae archaeon]|jgi:hypothetical protein